MELELDYSQLNEKEINHIKFHKFTRESFIKDVKMFTQVYNELGKELCYPRLNLKLEDVGNISDVKLIKAHMFYWNAL